MSATADHQETVPEIVRRLTGPGGAFELVREDVLGARIQVFARRERSLADVVAASVRHGDRDYIVTEDRRISFAGHARQVASLARALEEEYGVGKGDRVALLAANTPEWIVAFWATVSLGAIAVGYNAWWTAPEIAYGIEHTRPTVVLADAKRAASVDGSRVPVLTFEKDVPDLLRRYPDAPLPKPEIDEDDPAVIMYTSGTSGRPKGAVHTHRNLLAVIDYLRFNNALAAELGDPTAPEDRRHLLALPLFHIAALHNLAVPRLVDGGTVVMYQGRFEVDRVLRLIGRERVTNWGAVPTMAHRLIEHGDLSGYDLSSLTSFALASAPSTPAFHERLRAVLPVARQALANSYGLTECCTGAAVATPADLAAAPDSLGRPVVSVELEVRDPAGRPLPEGEEGEICLRSPYVMLGYWEDPEATARAVRADRWLHTGDIGMVRDGRLRLTSRRSDLILRGGENVYPAEIESVLSDHPEVRECLVIGVPHPDLGQEVAAVVVTDADSSVTQESLAGFLRARLAYYKVPSRWRVTAESLPRNATGKVIRREVRV
ncbi:class I adenylate-forming enzyme family protein [Streptomyces sp. H51]|uniref:class I adenylate-forming enzyme family protein n=1 Tax=Streptomyces sp. H51 TaxID=3111770 RepID=UPI002D79F240|nr:AMP-binding protein [Streptomyces sp. H51]